ncbi:MAG: DUF3179 domain-containing protein [Cyclobacteriaceae bacterium]|nr:DUF3179 domain-containing protein [Cyclobacteriaceae bacterium]
MKGIRLILAVSIVCLVALEVFRVYFIMPFPGSQQKETIAIAYFLQRYMIAFRIIGWIILAVCLGYTFSRLLWVGKVIVVAGLLLYSVVFYLFNYKFLADKMFLQPQHLIFHDLVSNKVDQGSLILGITFNGESKAYPIEIIGYHHQVRDSVGGEPVMITYCTVCRTGRVFSPIVNGKLDDFRLVGMDHFNAMFEDATTKSWWRQVTGEAIAGPLAGQTLSEFPTHQMSLRSWLSLHPDSKVMQPDSLFHEQYEKLTDFDKGTIASHLEYRDTLSWRDKSWVVGVKINDQSRAYDWQALVDQRIIHDTLSSIPLLIYLQSDSVSFHVWERDSLSFKFDTESDRLSDINTGSIWNMKGECISGGLEGNSLKLVQSYQEFWHSWRTFNRSTTRYGHKD